MYHQNHCSNSSPILELSVKFTSQIYHENINKPLDGAYLADCGIDIKPRKQLEGVRNLAPSCSPGNRAALMRGSMDIRELDSI